MKKIILSLACLFIILPTLFAAEEDNYHKQAREVLREVPLIDGHNDLPWAIRDKFKNHLGLVDLYDTKKINPPFHTDIPRLKSGMLGGQFWSVYVPVEMKGADPVQAVLEQIDIV